MPEPVPTQSDGDSDSDEILQLLQNVLDEQPGKSIPITREMRIDRYLIEICGDDELEYLQMSFAVEASCGIQLSNEDWKFLTGDGLCASTEEWEAKYAHMFTFGRLADLIAGRMKLGSLKPVTVFGATSLAAGAFRRVQVLAKRVDTTVEEFAPSTRVLDRFGGSKLREFWALLRAVSGNRVPPLEESAASRIGHYWNGTPGVVLSLMVGAAVTFGGHRVLFGGSLGSSTMGSIITLVALVVASLMMSSVPAILLMIVTGLMRLFVHRTGPRGAKLPREIETFRDLSLLIAGDRGGWCRECGYDLTGLDGGRCPECGTAQKEIRIPTTSLRADEQPTHPE